MEFRLISDFNVKKKWPKLKKYLSKYIDEYHCWVELSTLEDLLEIISITDCDIYLDGYNITIVDNGNN